MRVRGVLVRQVPARQVQQGPAGLPEGMDPRLRGQQAAPYSHPRGQAAWAGAVVHSAGRRAPAATTKGRAGATVAGQRWDCSMVQGLQEVQGRQAKEERQALSARLASQAAAPKAERQQAERQQAAARAHWAARAARPPRRRAGCPSPAAGRPCRWERWEERLEGRQAPAGSAWAVCGGTGSWSTTFHLCCRVAGEGSVRGSAAAAGGGGCRKQALRAERSRVMGGWLE
jgi:hypothetical protein